MIHSVAEQRRYAILVVIAAACLGLLAGCGPSRSADRNESKVTTGAKATEGKRYHLTGKVVSVDKSTQSMSVDGDEIPGFMAAMTMSYGVKDASVLDQLSPGDQIKADIVVGDEGASLENIVVTQKPPLPK